MEEAPLPGTFYPKEEIVSESLLIKQEKDTIQLNIKIQEETMQFQIIEKEPLLQGFSSKYNINEIKSINETFSLLKSCNEFLEYLKVLVNNNKIIIKKNKEEKKYISINFETEYLFKKYSIEIKLYPEKINLESNIIHLFEELSNIKSIIKSFENENTSFKEEKNKLIDEIKNFNTMNKNFEEKINNLANQNKIEKLNSEIIELKDLINKKDVEIKKLGEENNKLKMNFENELKKIREENNNFLKKLNSDNNIYKNKIDKEFNIIKQELNNYKNDSAKIEEEKYQKKFNEINI